MFPKFIFKESKRFLSLLIFLRFEDDDNNYTFIDSIFETFDLNVDLLTDDGIKKTHLTKYQHNERTCPLDGTYSLHDSFPSLDYLIQTRKWTPPDSLTFICTFTLTRASKTTNKPDNNNESVHWTLDDTSDFSIECNDGSKLKVHKHILMSKCSALETAFANILQNHAKEIKFVNTKPRAVKEMIAFIYTNKLGEIQGIEQDVIEIASKLEVDGLADACVSKLQENLSVASAVDFLILGQQNGLEKLKETSLSFIARSLTQVRQHESWKKISNHPELMLEILSHAGDSK